MTGPWLEIWKEYCFALNWFGPSQQTETDVMFIQRRQEYGNWFMNHAILRHCVFVDECSYNKWTVRNHGKARHGARANRQVCSQRGRNVTVALGVSPVNDLVFHSGYISGMNARRFNDFLAQTRQNLYPDEEVIFIYTSTINTSWRYSRPTAHSSGAGNQLTEYSDKRRRIETRNTGSYGRQRGSERRPDTQVSLRRKANLIATRCSSALHRCCNCC